MVNVGAVEIPSPHPLMGLAGLLASSRADLSALSNPPYHDSSTGVTAQIAIRMRK